MRASGRLSNLPVSETSGHPLKARSKAQACCVLIRGLRGWHCCMLLLPLWPAFGAHCIRQVYPGARDCSCQVCMAHLSECATCRSVEMCTLYAGYLALSVLLERQCTTHLHCGNCTCEARSSRSALPCTHTCCDQLARHHAPELQQCT